MASFQSKVSADAQQSILQFLSDEKSVKAVSKSFKEHVNKNQILDTLSRRKTTAQLQAPFEGTTWIVDPNRATLTDKEILNGFKGPCRSLLEAREEMQSGDKVLLCEGHHEWFLDDENDPHDAFEEDECLYIEGVGQCYLSFNEWHESAFHGKLSLSDIIIQEEQSRGYILMEFWNNACISLTDCVVDGANLYFYDQSSLNCIRCLFTDTTNQFAIYGQQRSSLTMVDCQIEMNRIPNKVVTPDYWKLLESDDKSKFEAKGGAVTMRLIGCTFLSQNMALNPMTKIQEGIDKSTSTFQYNKYTTSRQQ